jgi:hypothetical protein
MRGTLPVKCSLKAASLPSLTLRVLMKTIGSDTIPSSFSSGMDTLRSRPNEELTMHAWVHLHRSAQKLHRVLAHEPGDRVSDFGSVGERQAVARPLNNGVLGVGEPVEDQVPDLGEELSGIATTDM